MRYRVYSDYTLIHDSYIPDASMRLIDAKCTLADNSSGSFEFKIAPSNPGYNIIKRLTSTLIIQEDNNIIWTGRVISESEDFWKRRTFKCEGALSFLNDIYTPIQTSRNMTVSNFLTYLLNIYNTAKGQNSYRGLTLGVVTVTDTETSYEYATNNETIWASISKFLIDRLGGHIRVRYNGTNPTPIIDYYETYPSSTTQTIEFGTNLLDFTKNWDLSEIATMLLPRGKELDEPDSNGQKQYISIETVNTSNTGKYYKLTEAYNTYGRIEKIVDFPDVESPSVLFKMIQLYASAYQFEDMVINVSAVDLHSLNSSISKFSLLDSVRCISKPHGMDKFFPITSIEIDLNSQTNTKYTLGRSNSESLSSNINSASITTNTRFNALAPQYDTLDAAKYYASNILNQRTTGYVNIVQQNDVSQALIISNTENWTQATKHWKFDMNGLGYWNGRYANGQRLYETAITMNGEIVANFITTGVLSDGVGKNYWNLTTGDFSLSPNTKITTTNNGVTVSKTLTQYINDNVDFNSIDLSQQKVFNALTNNGSLAGIYMRNNQLYINATYIKSGIITDNIGLNSWNLNTGAFSLSETSTINGVNAATVASGATATIGGTNLLIDSNAPSLTKVAATANRYISDANNANWISAAFVTCSPGVNGVSKGVKFTAKASYNSTNVGGRQRGLAFYGDGKCVPMRNGEKYTVSCYARLVSGKARVRFQIGTNKYPNGGLATLTTAWKQYSWTFTYTNAATGGSGGTRVYICFVANGAAGVAEFCGFKLEKGTKATDWSAAPEDTTKDAANKANAALTSANSTTTTKVTNALNESKRYTNAISNSDRNFTKQQRQALDNALNQNGVLKRLTNNWKSKGIWLQPSNSNGLKAGQLYINGSYIKTGVLDANIIRAGILTDSLKAHKTKWNLATGYFETVNAVIKNANVTGQFTCGNYYKMELKDGRLNGYENNRRVGYIDYTATSLNLDNGRHMKGMQIQANEIVRISTPWIAVKNTADVYKTAIFATTRRIEYWVVEDVWDAGGGSIGWRKRTHGLDCINGLIIDAW